jgi:hypothetical protein
VAKKNPIVVMKDEIQRRKEKDIVALLIIKRKKGGAQVEYAVSGDEEDKIIATSLFREASQIMMKQLVKDGILEEPKNTTMYR